MKIYLIRHGETSWSLAEKHTGLTDIPLTAHGKKQAEILKTALKNENFSQVWTSPLLRAKETCALAGFSSKMKIDSDLVEWNYGDYEGLTTQEIRKKNPDWNLFQDGPKGGETCAQISARADRVLAKIQECTGDIALFSSAHFLRVLAARYLGLSVHEGSCFLLSPASISVLSYEHNTPVLALWNHTPS